MKAFFFLFAVFFFATACSDTEPAGENSDPYSGNPTKDHPAVGVLKSGGYEVTLHSAEDGPRYTLRDRTGSLLAQQITRREMAARFPKIHEEILTLWAGNDIRTAVPIDSPINSPAIPDSFPLEKVEVEVETVDFLEIPVK